MKSSSNHQHPLVGKIVTQTNDGTQWKVIAYEQHLKKKCHNFKSVIGFEIPSYFSVSGGYICIENMYNDSIQDNNRLPHKQKEFYSENTNTLIAVATLKEDDIWSVDYYTNVFTSGIHIGLGSEYVGQCKGYLPHGQGEMSYSFGDVYEGQWKDGKRHGQGKCTYSWGEVYIGQWKDNKRHGQGKQIDDGDIYNGQWKDGKRHGQGKQTFAYGEVYEGEFQNDKYHGQGTITYNNGDAYIGQWENGQRYEPFIPIQNGKRMNSNPNNQQRPAKKQCRR